MIKRFSTIIFLFVFISMIRAQEVNPGEDNPNVDHVPRSWTANINYLESIDAIITIDGFDNFDLGVDFAEGHLAVNPLIPSHIFNAWNTNSTHRTIDGYTWATSTPSFGASMWGDPVVAYDGAGNLYYMNMYGSFGIQGAKVIRSTNNGATWNASVTAVSGGDKCWIAADQTSGPYSGYVYAVMTSTSFSSGNFGRSINNGQTFNQTATFNTQNLPGMMVAVGPDVSGTNNIDGGAVYVVTNGGSTFSATYSFYVSTNGGQNFTLKSSQNWATYVGTDVNGRHSIENMRTRPYPFIAADNSNGPYRGRFYCVYAKNDPPGNGNKPDIISRYSDDQGATWSGPVMVNDDPNTRNNHQWHPIIWCDTETGRLYVQWMDTRDTPSSDSAYVYATYSEDGGVTFKPNQRISNQNMKINCTTCGGGGTPRYQGDYNGIASVGNVGMAAWADFRFGQFGSYFSYFPDFAMTALPALQTVSNQSGSTTYEIGVPDVKLYEDIVFFSADISPAPVSGNLTLSFPGGNSLNTFPGNVTLEVQASGGVSIGTYTITVTGQGPNGVPVHKRTVELFVEDEIPVELVAFSAELNDDRVDVIWRTATETNNKGFEIERAFINNGTKSSFNMIGFVEGHGNSTEMKDYKYTDDNIAAPGLYAYRLKQLDFDGTFEYTSSLEIMVDKPLAFDLSNNFPNPFNPSTTIKYSIPKESKVKLIVFDAVGQIVSELVNQIQAPSQYDVQWHPANLASGAYFYSIEAVPTDGSEGYREVSKMLLLK